MSEIKSPSDQLLYSRDDAARLLGRITPRRLDQFTKSGELRYIRVGGRIMFDPADLRRFIDERRSQSVLVFNDKLA